ncbi:MULTISPECIES: hypothetical protein [Microbispora]|jgi:hypothetical protein|uniref:Uncharacterized protein n=1 Tax=Microbispora hainanensis TaxID=568844 RepID=A0ABZ1SRE9_9ACTN|nr:MULTISPECIES: hypothetical protein [Microbispora]
MRIAADSSLGSAFGAGGLDGRAVAGGRQVASEGLRLAVIPVGFQPAIGLSWMLLERDSFLRVVGRPLLAWWRLVWV